MHLKAIELHGFKSFPDKTRIDFENGITAIVGPNGSGKSNIADAIRWVLGEQSTKVLRGSKMEDVIFDGTADRKSVGFAEVSLTIDNEDGVLPIEYTQVTVTRRYYRSGESEYYINKNLVRLKDVNELFMDTGIGKDGYSIIGQGRIAEILSVKSEDRRQIFEEAAGISKFRYRKQEAERKLRATDENLLRVLDIVAELESRIGPLKDQSDKAKKYLNLRDEKKFLEVGVWLDALGKAGDIMEKVKNDCETVKNGLADAEKRLNEIEVGINLSFEKQKEHTANIDAVRNEIKDIEADIADKNSQIAVINNDILHNNEYISRIDAEISSEQSILNEINEKISIRENEASELAKKELELKNQLDIFTKQSLSTTTEQRKHGQELDEIRNEIVSKGSSITEFRIRESSLKSVIEAGNERADNIASGDLKRQEELDGATSERQKCLELLKGHEDTAVALSNTIEGYKLKFSKRHAKCDELREAIEKTERSLFDKKQRRNMLLDLQLHFEGYAGSVKAIMEESMRTLDGIYGPVSSLIKADEQYSVAVETALGGAASHIIVENEGNAKSAIYFLKKNSRGRATFLPLSTMKGTTITGLSRYRGFVGIASDLISYDSKFNGVILHLLGRTAVVSTIDDAIYLAKSEGYKFKVVTLDGQVVNAGGSLTGGDTVRTSGALTRANEITKLEPEIEKYEQSLGEMREKLRSAAEEESALSASLEGAQAENRVVCEEIIREKTRLSGIEDVIFSLNTAMENSNTEKQDAEKKAQDAEKDIYEINGQIKLIEEEISKAEEIIARLSGTGAVLQSKQEQLEKDISEKRMEIVTVSKDREATLGAIDELKKQLQFQMQAGEKRQQEIEDIKKSIEEKCKKADMLSQDIKLLEDNIEDKKNETLRLMKGREESEGQITVLRGEEKSVGELRNKYVAESERLENKITALSAEYDNIISRMWDEYELTLSEAKLGGYIVENPSKATKRVNEIKNEIRQLGNINVDSIEEYKEVSERYEFLTRQVDDLTKSCDELKKIITTLTSSMKDIFADRFKLINEYFAKTFTELFGGGTARLTLTDPSEILTCGIEIMAAPPGKIIKNLTALSGGEQAFVAIALYFAILRVRPTPFCVLDEIEAALDDVNVVRFADYLRGLTENTQFISITHRRGTMEEADRLYGVTMQEKGVSRLLTININDLQKKLKMKIN